MDLNLIAGSISIILGMASILYGVYIISRLEGKLKKSVIFLIIAAAVFVAEMIAKFIEPDFTGLEIANNFLHMLIILFILLAVINMKQMIDGINNHYKKK